MNLKSMSIDRLAVLRDQVDAALSAKVIDQRRALASELSKLTHFQGGGVRGKSALGRGARGPVAAKYRNPENASETATTGCSGPLQPSPVRAPRAYAGFRPTGSRRP